MNADELQARIEAAAANPSARREDISPLFFELRLGLDDGLYRADEKVDGR